MSYERLQDQTAGLLRGARLPAGAAALAALVLVAWAATEDRPPTQADPAARNSAADWVAYHSRESKDKDSGPRLVIELEDGTSRSHPAAADGLLIAYLPDRNFGRHPELAINLADTNRVLLRFDPPAGKVRKAELVLTTVARGPKEPTVQLPPRPFELAVHEVGRAWDEARVTWDTQPAFAEKPTVTTRVDAKAKELRLDVTEPVRRLSGQGAPGHGWLLKVARPLPPEPSDGPPPGAGSGPEAEVLKLLPWEASIEAARAKARDGKKLVLAAVRAQYDDGTNFAEQVLIAATLADPDVRGLILARFVPVRVRYQAGLYLAAEEGKEGPDGPLAGLGVAVKDAKAPALVVATADGKAVATLASIGTFDRDLTLRFLLSAVEKAGGASDEKDPWKLLAEGGLGRAAKAFAGADGPEGRYGLARVASLRGDHRAALELCLPLARGDGAYRHEAEVQAAHALTRLGRFTEAEPLLRETAADGGPRATEAGYLLGCVLYRTGSREKAADAWRAVVKGHPRSPEAVRAKARLAWPEALAGCESLTAFEAPADVGRTEVDRSREEEKAVRRGVEYLLAQQGPDGGWTTATQSETYRVAVTALVARALHLWGANLDGELRGRARGAAEKATAWLNGQIKAANPRTCNSFGAAYVLDYFVDLEETKAAVRGDVKGAVELLLGGQCPNGAWSYDLRFGVSWRGGRGGWPETDQGRAHSINTGPALLALARANDLGFAVDPKALEAGRKALLQMRESAGVYTYTYPVPRSFHEKPDYSIGRGPVCEHALRRLGANTREDLEKAVACFLEYREDLRTPVKLSAGWMPPRMVSSYFYFYAYDHAARAIADGGAKAAERLALLRDDILKVVEADGTWVDCETYGKPYGTAMALHVLYLAGQARERAEGKP
jgi:Tetratricopeptide repeat